MSVGFPASLALDSWARDVKAVFYENTEEFSCGIYLVGSAAKGKGWRDVDVVLIMGDDLFDRWFGTHGGAGHSHDPKWAGICAAFCAWGKERTGLPIDFKIQRQTDANEKHQGHRSALGMQV